MGDLRTGCVSDGMEKLAIGVPCQESFDLL
jgi:hypothetical protein